MFHHEKSNATVVTSGEIEKTQEKQPLLAMLRLIRLTSSLGLGYTSTLTTVLAKSISLDATTTMTSESTMDSLGPGLISAIC